MNIYIARNRENDVWKHSSSGGIFYTIAEEVLSKKGIIYGAGYDKDNRVVHKRADTKEKVVELCGSKYVQSNIVDCFSQIAQDLKEDRIVLFVGTPCQVNAVKKYVDVCKIRSNQLITVDFICHGVPSPLFYQTYLKFMEKQMNDKIVKVNFRSKRLPFALQDMSLYGEKGHNYISYGTEDVYYNFYFREMNLRDCCYQCPYTSTKRNSDITLSDYWGNKDRIKGDLRKKIGLSTIMLNTKVGEDLFCQIADSLEYEEASLEMILQHNLCEPTKTTYDRDKFWEDFHNMSFEDLIQTYVGVSYKAIERKRSIRILCARLGILKVIRILKSIKNIMNSKGYADDE